MNKILAGAAAACAALFPALLLGHLSGPPPGVSVDPADKNPLACATALCHTGMGKGGPINAYSGYGVNATFSSGDTYTPGGPPVAIQVSVTDPVNTYYGFQMTARLADDSQAGDFSAGTNQIVICSDNSLKLAKACPTSSPVEYIEHFFEQPPPNKAPYSFTWTPPASNVGPVTFYVAGNSVDNPFSDVADAGDHVYTNKYVLTAAAETCSLSTPVITSVISASGFGALNTFAPGSWLEVYGTNLAPDTRPWGGSDFNGANAPTALDGVSVSIGGKPGFVYYIANSQINSQINVQAPAGTATGPAAVTVTNCAGTSAPYVINEAKFAPGVLAPPSFNIGGKQYMVAVRSCNPACTYIGKPDQPAKPGDTIVAYGIGFGDVTPSSPPGIVVGPTELNRLANPLTILFGQTPAAAPAYFGLAPNFVGLYQFNITVPDVPDGDVPVTFEVGGVQTTQTMYVTVHR